MISVYEALQIVFQQSIAATITEASIINAEGHVLAEDVHAPISLPPFQQSAMDGFAVKLTSEENYKIVGCVQAGDISDIILKEGEAVRIYTGAKVPFSADAVLMMEHVVEKNGYIKQARPYTGKTNIKLAGEQVKKGDLAIPKNTLLNSSALAYATALGLDRIKVYKCPDVALLITGNEVQPPGDKLEGGKIYDSNSIMLQLLLRKLGIKTIRCFFVSDEMDDTLHKLKEAIENYDILIASGGISVGDYDLMQRAFETLEVTQHFYKINQKPGKPIYFGTKEKTIVFGLPGNPAACFINFQVYVVAAIQKAMNCKERGFKKAVLKESIENSSGKSLFLRGNKTVDGIEIHKNQSSSMLVSLIKTDVLVYVPADTACIEKGKEVLYLDILQ
ncbi:molybdopterin molybdotransferase MoeA [Galbibacter sp. PAP.153]|uniref:molybdopterin molybdotransferase MoeA n=1 Tax=Galbibacter sp. PAP.153 TaxID=3104623 RepID=UPI00300BC081